MSITKEELQVQIENCPFAALEPHIKRGALIILDNSLDLVETTLLVVQDKTDKIEELINKELIKKPTQDLIDKWSDDKSAIRFDFLIAQPFVLAKIMLN